MKLRQLRKELNLTQDQLAEKANMRQVQISLWENGEVIPSLTTIRYLNELFGWNLTKFDFGS